MPTSSYKLEDLILNSRSFSLEQKQQLLRELPAFSTEQKEKLIKVFEEESVAFRKIDQEQIDAIGSFANVLKNL